MRLLLCLRWLSLCLKSPEIETDMFAKQTIKPVSILISARSVKLQIVREATALTLCWCGHTPPWPGEHAPLFPRSPSFPPRSESSVSFLGSAWPHPGTFQCRAEIEDKTVRKCNSTSFSLKLEKVKMEAGLAADTSLQTLKMASNSRFHEAMPQTWNQYFAALVSDPRQPDASLNTCLQRGQLLRVHCIFRMSTECSHTKGDMYNRWLSQRINR